jgi:hypothetical protein
LVGAGYGAQAHLLPRVDEVLVLQGLPLWPTGAADVDLDVDQLSLLLLFCLLILLVVDDWLEVVGAVDHASSRSRHRSPSATNKCSIYCT